MDVTASVSSAMPNPSIHRTLRDEAAQRPVISNVRAHKRHANLEAPHV
ncbi:MAG: hypothetical protein V4500_03590 [Pseudomonadota bacterium]